MQSQICAHTLPLLPLAGGLNEQSWRGQLKEFEGRLAASKAQWKLVVRSCSIL